MYVPISGDNESKSRRESQIKPTQNRQGKATAREGTTAFCRCGASKNKPYCYGSHKPIGFRADIEQTLTMQALIDPRARKSCR